MSVKTNQHQTEHKLMFLEKEWEKTIKVHNSCITIYIKEIEI